MPLSSVRLIGIDESAENKRLDQWLAAACAPEFSRSRLARLIGEGQVSVNGQVIYEPSFRLRGGGQAEITVPPAAEAAPAPQPIDLDILYEDADILIVNKPAGLVVHPGNGNADGTMVNALLYHCGEQGGAAKGGLSGIGGVKRPGIVHRLDKDTSGVMAVAKNDAAHLSLSRQFADHGHTGALERRYQALIWGLPEPEKGVIDLPLARAKHDRTRRAVASAHNKDARHAVTHYNIMRKFFGKDTADERELVPARLGGNKDTADERAQRVRLGGNKEAADERGSADERKGAALSETRRRNNADERKGAARLGGSKGAARIAASLAECRLETGRTHQIRVHMTHIGHPLIGDKIYGQAFKTKANLLPAAARQAAENFPRQALHAFYLRIEHPTSGEVMEFSAPLPADMQALLDALAGQSR